MADRKISRIKRLAKEGGWILAGQIATVLGSLMLVRVLTEHLDPVQYGQLALGLTVAQYGALTMAAAGALLIASTATSMERGPRGRAKV